jgi:hypothetical protein
MTIANRAMLVDLTQRVWQATSSDRSIASRVEQDHAAHHRSMKVVKQLVPREKLLPINRLASMGREHHQKLTLPGLVVGQQLLATRLFDEYASSQSDIKEAFYAEVKSFASDTYPQVLHEAPRRLGKAFRASDFPKVEGIISHFSYEHRFFPVPEGENWFLDNVSPDAMTALKNQVEGEKNDLFREAAKTLMERTKAVLDNLVSQIDTFDPDGPSGKLRDVTINSVKEMAELVGHMNLTSDPEIDAIAKEMTEHFQHLEGADLRKQEAVRSKVADIAKRILKRIE